MTTKTQHFTASTAEPWGYWRGLNGWNFYFLAKLALFYYGYLNFHFLANLVFMAFLLFPLPPISLHRLRNWLALPIGLILFYYDTGLPGFQSFINLQANLSSFNSNCWIVPLKRFINWQILGAGFVLLVAYLFVARWIRVTPLIIIAVLWLNLIPMNAPTPLKLENTACQQK